jgi:hypothetical protein
MVIWKGFMWNELKSFKQDWPCGKGVHKRTDRRWVTKER